MKSTSVFIKVKKFGGCLFSTTYATCEDLSRTHNTVYILKKSKLIFTFGSQRAGFLLFDLESNRFRFHPRWLISGMYMTIWGSVFFVIVFFGPQIYLDGCDLIIRGAIYLWVPLLLTHKKNYNNGCNRKNIWQRINYPCMRA
jgi:hypothetical protein